MKPKEIKNDKSANELLRHEHTNGKDYYVVELDGPYDLYVDKGYAPGMIIESTYDTAPIGLRSETWNLSSYKRIQ